MKFRKRPVVIEAIKYNGTSECLEDISKFTGLDMRLKVMDGDRLEIDTLEGPLCASVGDWIIRGVNGEFYPCKPDVFEKTYEAVE